MSADYVIKALASRDVNVIKKLRGKEMSRVYKHANRILKILKISGSSSYDHEIIAEVVKEAELSLEEAIKNVQLLHDGYQWYRDEGKDAIEEEKIENEQNDYIVKIEDKYYEGRALIGRYREACEIGQGELFLKNVMESFENAKKVVQDTQNSEHKIKDEYIEEKKVEEVAKKPSQFIGDQSNFLSRRRRRKCLMTRPTRKRRK